MELESEKYQEVAVEEFGTEETVISEESCVTDTVTDVPPQDISSQTDSVCTESKGTQTDPFFFFTARKFAGDSQAIHFYTGLEDYDKFCFVLQTLGPAAYELNYFHGVKPSLSVEDQFFLTLVKLRQHTINLELSILFEIHQDAVQNIFVTWINFMACQWGEINWWPSGDLVRIHSPTDFKQKFPSTRVIIDVIECPIKKPKEQAAQQATFSIYKNRNTVKVLVGMSPSGLITYVSPAYGGSVSDREICQTSALREMCDPGDRIMADQDLNVHDIFEGEVVSVNEGDTVMKDGEMASKRVYIGRIVRLCKTYKILRQPMNNTESELATQIIKVSEIDGKVFFTCNEPITVEQINGLKTAERIFVRINYLPASDIDRKDKHVFVQSLCDKILNQEDTSVAFHTYRQLFAVSKQSQCEQPVSKQSQCEQPVSKKVKYDNEYSEDTHSSIPAVPTFRISCKISGRFKGSVHPQYLSQKLGAKLVNSMGWKVDLKHPQVEVCVHINDEHVIAGIPTSKIPVSKRNYIARPGLRSTIAWIMCHLADVEPGDVVLDPMCGKATILVEGALNVKSGVFIGCDNDLNQLQCALENRKSATLENRLHLLYCSCLGLPFQCNSIDRVVCDAPFGQKFTTDIKLEDFYTKLLKEILRVLKVHGKAVVMTSSDMRSSVIKQLNTLDSDDGASTVSDTHATSSDKNTVSLESLDTDPQKGLNHDNSTIQPEAGIRHHNEGKNSSHGQKDNVLQKLTFSVNTNITSVDNDKTKTVPESRIQSNLHADVQKEPSEYTTPSSSPGKGCVTSTSTGQQISSVCSSSGDQRSRNETSNMTNKTGVAQLVLMEDHYVKLGETSAHIIVMQKH